jgi:urocanate hydratase
MVVVADGTEEADGRIERVFTTDPGIGIVRHADAGYEEAVEFGLKSDINMPMFKKK